MLGVRRGSGGVEEWCVASEDCAFGPIGFRRVRDVRPGEMIVIEPSGQLHSRQCVQGQVRRSGSFLPQAAASQSLSA